MVISLNVERTPADQGDRFRPPEKTNRTSLALDTLHQERTVIVGKQAWGKRESETGCYCAGFEDNTHAWCLWGKYDGKQSGNSHLQVRLGSVGGGVWS